MGGFRRETDATRIATVSGGLTGTTIVLDIGNPPAFHITATLRSNGAIAGTTALGEQTYRFTATPRKT